MLPLQLPYIASLHDIEGLRCPPAHYHALLTVTPFQVIGIQVPSRAELDTVIWTTDESCTRKGLENMQRKLADYR